MVPQKITNSQSNIEKEEQVWRYYDFLFQIILQGYNNQNSILLEQKLTQRPMKQGRVQK